MRAVMLTMKTDNKRDRREKVPVTVRALVQRINRKIARDGEMLRSAHAETPFYYVVDIRGNYIVGEVNDHAELETLARKCAALKPWERLQS
jgi:hypothetical protein